jgi:hypothetical protein
LLNRRIVSGESEDVALSQVAKGAVEGWYGYSGDEKRTGLVARMQQALGTSWNPTEAVLVYTLSQAIDDLTTSSTFQNRSFYKAFHRLDGQNSGPRPHQSAPGKYVQDSGTGVSASGTVRTGSSGHYMINDNGFGGAYSLRSVSEKGVGLTGTAWIVVRYE